MPVFQGLVSEEQLNALVAYVKSLNQGPSEPAGGPMGCSVGRAPAGNKGEIAMATAAITAERDNYLNQEYGIKSWLLTVDRKTHRPALPAVHTFFFFIGGIFCPADPHGIADAGGRPVQAETLTTSFSPCTDRSWCFFSLIPSIPNVLGNFLVPLMIGAKNLAFPRINLLSWYLFIIGGALMLHCILTGGTDTGWTFCSAASGPRR